MMLLGMGCDGNYEKTLDYGHLEKNQLYSDFWPHLATQLWAAPFQYVLSSNEQYIKDGISCCCYVAHLSPRFCGPGLSATSQPGCTARNSKCTKTFQASRQKKIAVLTFKSTVI